MIRAFQWDIARQVERLDVLTRLLPRYAEWGYTELYLHLEDAVEYPSLPSVARPDAYRYDELEKLVNAASRVGIGVVPIVNLLGHTQYLIKTADLRDLNELRDDSGAPLAAGQICPLHPRTSKVVEALLDDMRPFCTAGKVHVGLDESFHLGKCPRCRAEIKAVGLAGHFARHVKRLHAQAQARDLRMGIWADMLYFIPEAIERLPPGLIAYDWYYYGFQQRPRVELFNFAEVDLAPRLRKRGIEYWGCPMNGAFRFEPIPIFSERLSNIRSWWKRCKKVSAGGILVTSWEAYRLALETTTVVDASASQLWRSSKALPDEVLLRKGFGDVFNLSAKLSARCAKAALASDVYPFAGYAKWEVNERWDVRAFSGASKGLRKETAGLRRLVETARRTVAPLEASLRLRLYFAQRDLLIAEAGDSVSAIRRALRGQRLSQARRLIERAQEKALDFVEDLQAGRRAAEEMWRRTRVASALSQNREILKRDTARYQQWQRWLQSCAKNPEIAWQATPVCGDCQIVFTVLNDRPALQRVSVESQGQDGSWTEVHGRYTIEFQAAGAKRRANIRRIFSAPLDRMNAELRLVLKGLGEVKIEEPVVTNGIDKVGFGSGSRTTFRLGKPAPRRGFPDVKQVQEIKKLTPMKQRV